MPECLYIIALVISYEIILLIFVISLILKRKTHAKQPLLHIFISLVGHIDIFIGNLFIILWQKIQLICRTLHHITDRFWLNKIKYSNQVRYFLYQTHKHNLNSTCFHCAFIHLYINHRDQHFLWRWTAMYVVESGIPFCRKNACATRAGYNLIVLIPEHISQSNI